MNEEAVSVCCSCSKYPMSLSKSFTKQQRKANSAHTISPSNPLSRTCHLARVLLLLLLPSSRFGGRKQRPCLTMKSVGIEKIKAWSAAYRGGTEVHPFPFRSSRSAALCSGQLTGMALNPCPNYPSAVLLLLASSPSNTDRQV